MKKVILYIVVMLIFLWSGASFAAEDLTSYSVYASLQSDTMKALASNDFETLVSLDNVDNEDTIVEDEDPSQVLYALETKNDEIVALKYRLYYMDYLTDKPADTDTVLDEAMSQALKKYQEDNSLAQSGVVDKATYDLLNGEQITYVSGKDGNEIREYQLILYYMDYINVYPSGYFGTITVEAVKAYQEDNNIEINGKLDLQTQQLLSQEEYVYKKGKKGSVIKELQQILIDNDYLTGAADGDFGEKTRLAIIEFQKDNQLEQTGEIDKTTMDLLNTLKQ
jgi:peptidoglycan hydrolase-like protein with peptidoglycan-binding domain